MIQTASEQVEPELSRSSRVSVPERMYLAMAHCYFGGGPRFRELAQSPSIAELPSSDEDVGKLPPLSGPVMISRPLPGKPMGVAASELSPKK